MIGSHCWKSGNCVIEFSDSFSSNGWIDAIDWHEISSEDLKEMGLKKGHILLRLIDISANMLKASVNIMNQSQERLSWTNANVIDIRSGNQNQISTVYLTKTIYDSRANGYSLITGIQVLCRYIVGYNGKERK